MSCLFYCICRHPGPEVAATLPGVGGGPVYQIAHKRLSATVSRIGPEDLVPDLARIRAYERVVSSHHRQGTVIPMRYGCVLEQDSQVTALLAEHTCQYETLLQELEDCVELGLRVLIPQASLSGGAGGEAAGSREVSSMPPRGASRPERLGLAYLTARKAHYAQQDRWTGEYRRTADRCLAHFAGLFAKAKAEAPSARLPLLSLYFLVPCAAVQDFRQAYRRLSAAAPARLLLSGPWPPYNFVTSDLSLF